MSANAERDREIASRKDERRDDSDAMNDQEYWEWVQSLPAAPAAQLSHEQENDHAH